VLDEASGAGMDEFLVEASHEYPSDEVAIGQLHFLLGE
jgi:hypothetical protein